MVSWIHGLQGEGEQIGAIREAEERLGCVFPPSYRAYLAAARPGLRLGVGRGPMLRPSQLVWFRDSRPRWITAFTLIEDLDDASHRLYGSAQDPCLFRRAHLAASLQISRVHGDAVYLLCPSVLHGKGEWEAWFFARWLPGARRYRSFREMVLAERPTPRPELRAP